jgi:hypothetical protein
MKRLGNVLLAGAAIVLSVSAVRTTSAQSLLGAEAARSQVRDDLNSDPTIRSPRRIYGNLPGPLQQYSYLPPVGPYSDFPSVPGRPDLQAGDTVRIKIGGAPVMLHGKVIEEASPGMLAKVLTIQSPWVGIEFSGENGQVQRGWIRAGQVSRVEPPPVLAGQLPGTIRR